MSPFLAFLQQVGSVVGTAAIRLQQGTESVLATIDPSSIEAAHDALIRTIQVLKWDEVWIRPTNLRECKRLDTIANLAFEKVSQ